MLDRWNVALFFAATLIGVLAHSMFSYALVIHCDALTGQGSLTAVAILAVYVPMCVLTLPRGAQADSGAKRPILIRAQGMAGLVVVVYAAYLSLGWMTEATVLATLLMCVLYGFFAAGVAGARMALLPIVVGEPRIEPAMILVSLFTILAFGIGPLIVGGTAASGSWSSVYMAPGALLLVSAALLAIVRETTVPSVRASTSIVDGLRDGARYLRDQPLALQLIGLVGALTFCILGPFQTLVPSFANHDLGLGEGEKSLLVSTFAVGLLLGAASAIWVSRLIASRGRLFLIGGALGSAAFLLAPLTGTVVGAAAALVGSGFSLGLLNALVPSSIQENVLAGYRGRVMSLYSLLMLGAPALGGATFAAGGDWVGKGTGLAIAGGTGLVMVLLMSLSLVSLRSYTRPARAVAGLSTPS